MARAVGRRAIRIAGAVVVVLGFGALTYTGLQSESDDDSTTTTTQFTLETDAGRLTFDDAADGDGAVVEFEGEEAAGLFSFDLDGDGSVTEGEGGSFELTSSLPEGWPSDFPLPPDAEFLRGSIVDSEALVQRSATFRTAPSAEETVEWYRVALTDAGAVVVLGAGEVQDGAATTLSFEGPWTGFVTVAQGGLVTELGVQLFGEIPG